MQFCIIFDSAEWGTGNHHNTLSMAGRIVTKSASFRFYEELNDFIPSGERKRDRQYCFSGTPSVKDAIEAQNVPHTEVDLILVNGEPVDFSHKLRDGDRVSVYPVFETFDIGPVKPGGTNPVRHPAFILDVHLGKLAKLLRMTGFDTCYRNDMDDDEIIEKAVNENRIILTRDLGILKNSKVLKGCFIRSQKPAEQLKEVVMRFQLRSSVRILTRCMECNGTIDEIDKKEVEKNVSLAIVSNFNMFYRCVKCGRIYWKGSHYDRMMAWCGEFIASLEE